MIALGVFVLVIVGLASLAVVFRGGDPVTIDLHFFTIKTTAGFVFLAGAVALALVAFGLSLLWEGLKRGRKRRKETKSLRSRAEATESSASTGGSSGESGPATGSGSQAGGAVPANRPPTDTTGGSSGTAERSGPDDHFDTTPRDH